MKSVSRILLTSARRVVRAAPLATWLNPRVVWRRLRLYGKDRQGVFTEIYERRLWDARESASGSGSTLEATASLRTELPGVLSRLGVRSLLDAPCGDFHWMEGLDLELGLDVYVGGEIVPGLVETLNERFSGPSRRFVHIDITKDPLPRADAFFCRDCLIHLPNDDVARVIDNALRSSCRYFLASTYPDCARNQDIPTGLSRALNLCLAPFDLPPPILTIADPGKKHPTKRLAVWDLGQLRAERKTKASSSA